MKCKIEGCLKEVRFIEKQVCQMHYFRYMRNGYYELKKNTEERKKIAPRGRVYRRTNPKGYQLLYIPEHPLSHSTGYVYEHRLVIYKRYGENLPNCQICDKPCSWEPYKTHIDHIDEDVSNNEDFNLRVLCNACNVGRSKGKTPKHKIKGATSITYFGETKTASEWGRDSRINVAGHLIRQRKRRGLSDHDCLFMPKITHNGKGVKSDEDRPNK